MSSPIPTADFGESLEVVAKVSGAIVHLIDKHYSIELASGDFEVVRLRQNGNVVAVLARVGDEIQWPLAKDEAVVKLDQSHYFFNLRAPSSTASNGNGDEEEIVVGDDDMLNYGLTVASKGQANRLKVLDEVLEHYSYFSVQQVNAPGEGSAAQSVEMSPEEMEWEGVRDFMGERSAAYWTALAPNVDDYSSLVARAIAAGSAELVKGILWCGDVTVGRLMWGNEFLKENMGPPSESEISPETFERIQRVKCLTKMSEDLTNGILTGVVQVSGFVANSIANSKMGKKFFSQLPGEIVLASLEAFGKIFDAIEIAGKQVMSTTSIVTTGLVSQRFGEEAAEATNEGLDAAGHAIGSAWAVFKIRKALNLKNIIKPTTLAKAAAEANYSDLEAKYAKHL